MFTIFIIGYMMSLISDSYRLHYKSDQVSRWSSKQHYMDHSLISLSLPMDSCFLFHVYTGYDDARFSPPRAAPNLPGWCMLNDIIGFLIFQFIFFVKSADVLQFQLGHISTNEIHGLSYVYAAWYARLELGFVQSNT